MPHQCTNCGKTFDDGSKQMLSGCPDCGGNKFQFQPSGARKSSASESAEPAAESAEASPESTETVAESTEAPAESAQPESAPAAGRDADEREKANAERERPEQATDTEPADTREGTHVDTTAAEDRAQHDARSTHATADELEEARRRMAESEDERRSEVADGTDEKESNPGRSKRGRGAPQGPPMEPPDEDAAEEFGLSGAVGPPDEQAQSPTSEEYEAEEPMGGSDTDLSALREELNDQFESIKITAPGQYELNLMELYDRKEYIISLQEDGRYVVDIPEGHNLED